MASAISRFSSVKYTGKLVVSNPSGEDESYRLLIFASRNAHQHAAFNELVVLPTSHEEFEFEYTMPRSSRPTWLHFLLFANAPDNHGILNQSLLAWGSTGSVSGGVIALVDVKQKTQAVFTVQPKLPISIPAQLQPSTATSEISDAMINRVRAVYKELTHTVDSYLNWVVTPMGKIPVLPFIASVSCILTDTPTDQERGEEFIRHQFEIARINLGLDSTEWQDCSFAQQSKWLTEAVTLIPRSMVYEQDSVRIDKDHHEPADQWVRLLSFPELNLAAFDCEDSAITCLEVLYLIQHVRFQNSFMKRVQKFCQPYTACFIFGSLQISNSYCPHAYAALLDSDFLDGRVSNSCAPAIIFEGTARLGGSWTEDKTTKASDDSFLVHTSIIRALGPGKGYGRVLRNESSLQFVKENGIYGPVYGVLSGDHHGRDAIHLLARAKSSKQIGVSADDLFTYSSSCAFTTACSYPNATRSEFMMLCNELPRSHIPFVATSKTMIHKNSGEFYVAMHYEAYMQRQDEVQAAIKNLRGSFTITSQVLRVTDQLKLQQLWFRPSPA